ncbi:MAG TPA: hypothetical protein VMW75_14215 [Thermoanaerobaculia bacterium]|nr:hypothetical protein [Thermoanaerobaculia bacterium]
MQAKQPEHPRRRAGELRIGPGEHDADASRWIAGFQGVKAAAGVAQLGRKRR